MVKSLLLLVMTVFVSMCAIRHYYPSLTHNEIHQPHIHGVYLTEERDVPDFRLTDHVGNRFTQDNLKGQWTLVFFGFTNCAMVCPLTMTALNGMYKQLKHILPEHQLPRILLVSVDPERDTISRLHQSIHAYNDNFIGSRGDRNDTKQFMDGLHILTIKMEVEKQGKNHYTLDHTADIFVFNPNGRIQAFLTYPHTTANLITDYQLILGQYYKRHD